MVPARLTHMTAAGRRLFAGGTPAPALTAASVVLSIALVGGGTLLSLLRQTGLPATSTIWAEDGSIFLQQAMDLRVHEALANPYAGYLHVVPRMWAEVAGALPLQHAAAVFAVGAAVSWAALALLVYHVLAVHVPWRLARAGVAVGIVLMPVGQEEVLNSVANLHWPLIFVAFCLLLWRPRTSWEAGLGAAVLVLAVLSDPLVLLLSPLALGRFLTSHRGRGSSIPVAFAGAAVLQVVAMVTNPVPRELPLEFDVVRIAWWYVSRALTGAVFGSALPAAAGETLRLALVAAAVAAAGAVTLLAVRTRGRRTTPLVSVCLVASVVLYAAPAVLSGVAPPRYAVAPILFLYLATAIVLSSLWEPAGSLGSRDVAVVLAVVTLVALGWGTGYRVDNERSLGPPWDEELAAVEAGCAPSELGRGRARISPRGWEIEVPCAEVVDR